MCIQCAHTFTLKIYFVCVAVKLYPILIEVNTMDNITIRKAVSSDVEEIVELRLLGQKHCARNAMLDRFLHSFYNELGFSNEEEGRMLFEYSIYRATVEARNKKDRQRTEEILRHLETKLQSMVKELLSQNLRTR